MFGYTDWQASLWNGFALPELCGCVEGGRYDGTGAVLEGGCWGVSGQGWGGRVGKVYRKDGY